MNIYSESTIILAVVGSVGILAAAATWMRVNAITSRYYGSK